MRTRHSLHSRIPDRQKPEFSSQVLFKLAHSYSVSVGLLCLEVLEVRLTNSEISLETCTFSDQPLILREGLNVASMNTHASL